MTAQLTPRQRQVLDLIRISIDTLGYPPTRAEIAAELGFRSVNAAEDHLRALARKGFIGVTPGTSRGLRLLTQESGLPLVGRVAAGQPILAREHIERHCDIAAELFYPRADYLLRVTGISMINAGIRDGDLIAVHKTAHAEHGQLVVARINDEVTVKRFTRTNAGNMVLVAENPDFAPIEIGPELGDFAVEGLCVGVIRTQC